MTHDIFGDPIAIYTRTQAIEDGVLVDASTGDLAEVSRQHYKWPVAMTAAVYNLMDRAVQDERLCNDWKGVWHDVLWMSRKYITKRLSPSAHLFEVATSEWSSRKRDLVSRVLTLKIVCGPGDHGEPVLTVMLPGED